MIDTPITSNNPKIINSNTHNDSFITLCTLNIQGLNDPMKQTQLMNYAKTQHYDIIGLTETHFITYNNTYTFKNHPSLVARVILKSICIVIGDEMSFGEANDIIMLGFSIIHKLSLFHRVIKALYVEGT